MTKVHMLVHAMIIDVDPYSATVGKEVFFSL